MLHLGWNVRADKYRAAMLKTEGLSSVGSPDCSSTDVYRMCKKIAQLTKVIYNLNVKNDELEVRRTHMQHDYEKKIWKLSADVQQHAANAASMLRSETAQTAELSQVRTHLEEQMARSEQLVDELAQTNQQHATELDSLAMERDRQLSDLADRLAAEAAGWRAELERTRCRLEEADGELVAARADRARAQERTATLEGALQKARAETDQARADAEEQTRRSEEWRTATVQAKEVEVALRRELSELRSDHAAQLDQLRAQLAAEQLQLSQRAGQLSAAHEREAQMGEKLDALAAERDRAAAEAAAVAERMKERDGELQERDRQLHQLQQAVQLQESHRGQMVEQLRVREQELATCRALREAGERELRQRAAQLARACGHQQRLQADSAAAKSHADQLSQLLLTKHSEISQLEARLAEAASTTAAAAEPPPPSPSSRPGADDAIEVNRLRAELASVRQQLSRSDSLRAELERARRQLSEAESERDQQASLLQSALQESAEMEATLRGRLQRLQTLTSQAQNQLMQDAEQRLREVQRDCKRQLDEQRASVEERTKATRQAVEAELQVRFQTRAEQDATVTKKLQELDRLRPFEVEAVQLRGLTHELMRELRVGTRQLEMARTQEARVAEDNRRLTERLAKLGNNVQQQKDRTGPDQLRQQRTRHQQEQAEAALTARWEERLRDERARLKVELDALHVEERQLAVEAQRLAGQQQLQHSQQQLREADEQRKAVEQQLKEKSEQLSEAEQRCRKLQAQLSAVDSACQQQAELDSEAAGGQLQQQLRQAAVMNGSDEEVAGEDDDEEDADVVGEDDDDEEEGAGDSHKGLRHQIEMLLRRRPGLRADWDALLAEREAEAAAAHRQLEKAQEQRERDIQEHQTEVAALREQLAARDRLSDQLLNDLGATRHDLTQCSQRANVELRESRSQVQVVLASARRQVETIQQKTQQQLLRMRTDSQSAAQLAQQKIGQLEKLAVSAREQPRPQDSAAIEQLRAALVQRDQQLAGAQREQRQLTLELANRDASYSRLFAPQPARVGVIDPTAPSAAAGTAGAHAQPPSRPQRRQAAASRATKR